MNRKPPLMARERLRVRQPSAALAWGERSESMESLQKLAPNGLISEVAPFPYGLDTRMNCCGQPGVNELV